MHKIHISHFYVGRIETTWMEMVWSKAHIDNHHDKERLETTFFMFQFRLKLRRHTRWFQKGYKGGEGGNN